LAVLLLVVTALAATLDAGAGLVVGAAGEGALMGDGATRGVVRVRATAVLTGVAVAAAGFSVGVRRVTLAVVCCWLATGSASTGLRLICVVGVLRFTGVELSASLGCAADGDGALVGVTTGCTAAIVFGRGVTRVLFAGVGAGVDATVGAGFCGFCCRVRLGATSRGDSGVGGVGVGAACVDCVLLRFAATLSGRVAGLDSLGTVGGCATATSVRGMTIGLAVLLRARTGLDVVSGCLLVSGWRRVAADACCVVGCSGCGVLSFCAADVAAVC